MRRTRRSAAVVIAAVVLAAALPAGLAPAGAEVAIAQIPVSFEVVNRNTSDLPCASDGRPYTINGHIVGPAAELGGDRPRVITVLLTGMDEGEWTWRFTDVPGYDYPAEMARLGHISLSIDLLGYGASGKPHGQLSCFGSHADVTHQIVRQLRDGSYTATGQGAVVFSTVLLSGHDVGAVTAWIAAYSWPGDIDGVTTQIWAHQGTSPYILDIFGRRLVDCARGGMDADDPADDPDDPFDDPSRGGGYVLFGPPDEEFRGDLFQEARADPAVVEAVLGLRNRNPCGLVTSISPAIRMNLARIRELAIPVLLVFPGPDDPVFLRSGQEQEAANFTGTSDVTSVWLDSGHFMTLEACAGDFRALTARWIQQRWGTGSNVAAPAVGDGECVTETRTKQGS